MTGQDKTSFPNQDKMSFAKMAFPKIGIKRHLPGQNRVKTSFGTIGIKRHFPIREIKDREIS